MRCFLTCLAVTAGCCILSAANAQPTPAPTARVYRACPADKVWSEGGGCVCKPGLRWDVVAKRCNTTCPPGRVQAPNAAPGTCVLPPRTCPPGNRWSEAHDGCVVVCPAGKAANAKGTGCVVDPKNCPADTQWYETRSACLPFCAPGRSLDFKKGTCVDDPVGCAAGTEWNAARNACVASCRAGTSLDASGACTAEAPKRAAPPRPPTSSQPKKPIEPKPCPEGKEWRDAFDACVPICPADQVLDFYGVACHPIRVRR